MIASPTAPRWLASTLIIAVSCAFGPAFGTTVDDRLVPGTRVEIDGVLRGKSLQALKVVVEDPDEYPEIKGFPSEIDVENGRIQLGPFTVIVDSETEIEDDEDGDDSYRLDELNPDWRLKIEGVFLDPSTMRAVTIDVDRRKTRGVPLILELEGVIESRRLLSDGTTILVVHGIECRVDVETNVPSGTFTKSRGAIDDDDDRPSHQLVLWNRLTIGGEVQVDFEYEDDYDLDSGDNQDVFVADTSAILEGLFDLGRGSFAFGKIRTAKGYVIFDEDRDLDLHENTALDELYVAWREPLGIPLELRVGRQDFDEEREWWYDESLDAIRLRWQNGPWQVEYSWSTYVADAPRGRDEQFHQIATARYHYGRRSYFGLYLVDIQDRSSADDSPFYLGARVLGREDSTRYWVDAAIVDGVDGNQKVSGYGFDVGVAHQVESWPLSPYAYVGVAFGSGDGRPNGRVDRNFRQTGFQDNNDRFFGVASFRYYGELLRPELSNLVVETYGVGIRPTARTSIDLVFHRYHQVHRANTLRDSTLRASPSGGSRDLGSEVDLILGVDDLWGRWDLECDLGYFIPGSAFTTDDHPALWAALQIEWNF